MRVPRKLLCVLGQGLVGGLGLAGRRQVSVNWVHHTVAFLSWISKRKDCMNQTGGNKAADDSLTCLLRVTPLSPSPSSEQPLGRAEGFEPCHLCFLLLRLGWGGLGWHDLQNWKT